jgi:hypothetical protein
MNGDFWKRNPKEVRNMGKPSLIFILYTYMKGFTLEENTMRVTNMETLNFSYRDSKANDKTHWLYEVEI